MASISEIYTSREAADRLGITDAYVRQLCIAHEIGRKHGKMWLLTEADLLRIEGLPGFRNKPAN